MALTGRKTSNIGQKVFLSCLVMYTKPNKRASLIAQLVKNLPEIQEIWVGFPGWEDPLEKEMATLSSILAWTWLPRWLRE